MRNHRSRAASAIGAVALLVGAVSLTMASGATGVTPTLLVRGTFDGFKVMSNPPNGAFFKAEAKGPIDVVVRQHVYIAGGSTGWHAHPYPVFISVLQGTLTFYEYDDPTCSPIVVTAGHGYVDSGRGHIARNETGQPATDISVILAPVGAVFRQEPAEPGPFCAY